MVLTKGQQCLKTAKHGRHKNVSKFTRPRSVRLCVAHTNDATENPRLQRKSIRLQARPTRERNTKPCEGVKAYTFLGVLLFISISTWLFGIQPLEKSILGGEHREKQYEDHTERRRLGKGLFMGFGSWFLKNRGKNESNNRPQWFQDFMKNPTKQKSMQDYLREATTGDIILTRFTGKPGDNTDLKLMVGGIRKLGKSQFDHVAVVVPNEELGIKDVLQIDDEHGIKYFHLHTYLANAKEEGIVCIRQLQQNQSLDQKELEDKSKTFLQKLHNYKGRIEYGGTNRMIKAATRTQKAKYMFGEKLWDGKKITFFCSELVSFYLGSVGILKERRLLPKHFEFEDLKKKPLQPKDKLKSYMKGTNEYGPIFKLNDVTTDSETGDEYQERLEDFETIELGILALAENLMEDDLNDLRAIAGHLRVKTKMQAVNIQKLYTTQDAQSSSAYRERLAMVKKLKILNDEDIGKMVEHVRVMIVKMRKDFAENRNKLYAKEINRLYELCK